MAPGHHADPVVIMFRAMNSNAAPTHRSEPRVAACVAAGFICFLLAHHFAVFVHEYAHSFMAFALGCKSNPFQIHFGGTGLLNVLLLSGVDEQVDYPTMFAHDAGWRVALVALAGPGLGNGLTYFGSLAMMNCKTAVKGDGVVLFAFALNVMSVGNFFSYVPIRTFVSHGDIGHVTQGLGVSPWLPLAVLGIPTLAAMWWLFRRTMPQAMRRLACGALNRQRALVALTVAIVFGFFGLAGWAGYGTISHVLSGACMVIAPVVMVLCWPRKSVRHGVEVQSV